LQKSIEIARSVRARLQSIFGIHVDFSIAFGGGFFLRKKPLSSLASVYTNSENAIVVPKDDQKDIGL
jgi:hypothetical protein